MSRAAIASPPDLETAPGRPYRSLTKSHQFSTAYRTGQRRRCGGITVLAVPGPPGAATIGFVAGKKVGSAVKRNLAKRRLREAVVHSRLKSDTVYVLIADRGVLDAPFDRLVGWINRCVEELPLAGEKR